MTDQWEELDRLAKAAIADNDNPCIFAATQSLADFNTAANPATVLSLIAAARANPPEDEGVVITDVMKIRGARCAEGFGAIISFDEAGEIFNAMLSAALPPVSKE